MKLSDYFLKGMPFKEYKSLLDKQAKNGETSGALQSESLIYYTKLNKSRISRGVKHYLKDGLPVLPKTAARYMIVITETWCGDAAQNIPPLEKLAQAWGIDTRYLLRDENLELINAYLTNGGKSIPKAIILDANYQELATWGPRPLAAINMFERFKAGQEYETEDELKSALQQWYNSDKGESIKNELSEILSTLV